MNNEELHVVQKVIDNISRGYTFSSYEVDDIKQEAFLIAIKVLDEDVYDPEKSSLETFMYLILNNKLKTLIRDKVGKVRECPICLPEGRCEECNHRKQINKDRKNILRPISLDLINHDEQTSIHIEDDPLFHLELKEIKDLINSHLNIHLREDYLKMLDGLYIPYMRRKKVEEAILNIMEENYGESY